MLQPFFINIKAVSIHTNAAAVSINTIGSPYSLHPLRRLGPGGSAQRSVMEERYVDLVGGLGVAVYNIMYMATGFAVI